MPEPLSWKIGFGMNVTVLPAAWAVCLTTYLYFMTLSAVASSGPYRMSISAWPAVPTSWWCTSTVDPDLLRGSAPCPSAGPGSGPSAAAGSSPPCAAACTRGCARPPRRRSSRCPPPSRCGSSPRARSGRTGSSRRCRTRTPGPSSCVCAMPVCVRCSLGLARDPARVARVHLARHRVLHEAVDDQRRDLEERVDERAARVRHQEHVGLLDLLEPADRRAVEAEAGGEVLLVELARWGRRSAASTRAGRRSEGRRSVRRRRSPARARPVRTRCVRAYPFPLDDRSDELEGSVAPCPLSRRFRAVNSALRRNAGALRKGRWSPT